MDLHIHTQGRFNNRTVCTLYRIMVMATSVVGVMKREILCLEQDSNPHLWHSRPHRLPDVPTIPTSTYLCGSLPQSSVQTTTLDIQLRYRCKSLSISCCIEKLFSIFLSKPFEEFDMYANINLESLHFKFYFKLK